MPGLDLFLPNQVEAQAMSGADSPEEALEWLAARVPTVAVKRGPDGALAASGRERARMPGFSVPVRDTSGAGDAFDAGFLDGWLAGEPLAVCLARGNACGALTAAHVGGSGGFDRARMEAFLS
jgi:sugar/nucleoside kinase (ribokinase family)